MSLMFSADARNTTAACSSVCVCVFLVLVFVNAPVKVSDFSNVFCEMLFFICCQFVCACVDSLCSSVALCVSVCVISMLVRSFSVV